MVARANDSDGSTRLPAQYGRQVVRRIVVRFVLGLAVLSVLSPVPWLVVGVPSYVAIVVALVATATMLIADRRITPVLEHCTGRGNRG
jgi:4-hydroxybenzoate polyprenyltransferase